MHEIIIDTLQPAGALPVYRARCSCGFINHHTSYDREKAEAYGAEHLADPSKKIEYVE